MLINCNKNKKIDIDIYIADKFLSRLKGLIFKKSINYGLLLYPCNSIHTCFMRENIDVVFLDKEYNVKKIVENIKPWRFVFCRNAIAALELPGNFVKNQIKLNDKLIITNVTINNLKRRWSNNEKIYL